MLAPGPVAVLAGGEERGTWLVEAGAVSDRSFAYAVRLAREPGPNPLGRLVITSEIGSSCPSFSEPTGETPVPPMPGPLAGETAEGTLSHPAWFELLHHRRPFDGPAAEGWRLQLIWS
jgi:hypothetical protein